MSIISHCTLDTLAKAAASLKAGALVIFPTETVYGLGADGDNKDAIARIYQVKDRPSDHPLIIHIGELNQMSYWISDISDYALSLAREFWPGSMTLILKRSENVKDFITGGQESVGIRIPAHPLALQLLQEFHKLGGHGVAAPSANRFGKVSPTTAAAAAQELQGYLAPTDLILDGGASVVGIESTVIDCLGDTPKILRPGAISKEMIEEVTGLKVSEAKGEIRVSGALESHYAPIAHVFVGQVRPAGAGFIALDNVATPDGYIRLTSPKTIDEFARSLYQALRDADDKKIKEVVIIPPEGDGLAIAIRDRIEKARSKN
jgi:L-threonylcarbamoyladenylate synthase